MGLPCKFVSNYRTKFICFRFLCNLFWSKDGEFSVMLRYYRIKGMIYVLSTNISLYHISETGFWQKDHTIFAIHAV